MAPQFDRQERTARRGNRNCCRWINRPQTCTPSGTRRVISGNCGYLTGVVECEKLGLFSGASLTKVRGVAGEL